MTEQRTLSPDATGPQPNAEPAAGSARPGREGIGLAMAHRLGSVGLLCLIVGAVMIGRMPFYWYLLPAAFVMAGLGMLGGFLAWFFARRRGGPSAEPRNSTLFCAAVLAPALVLLVLVRLDRIGAS